MLAALPKVAPVVMCLAASSALSQVTGGLPRNPDWLISPETYRATIVAEDSGEMLHMQNGLIRRTFRLKPNAATVDVRSLVTGETYVRAVWPEAVLQINSRRVAVGGLEGQIEQGYVLTEWLDSLRSDTAAFQFAGYECGQTVAPFPYHRKRWGTDALWPPPGRSLTLRFRHASATLGGIDVAVHYEIYDGIPLIGMWFEIHNGRKSPLRFGEQDRVLDGRLHVHLTGGLRPYHTVPPGMPAAAGAGCRAGAGGSVHIVQDI